MWPIQSEKSVIAILLVVITCTLYVAFTIKQSNKEQILFKALHELEDAKAEQDNIVKILNAILIRRLHYPNAEVNNSELFDYLNFASGFHQGRVVIPNRYSTNGYLVKSNSASNVFSIQSKGLPKSLCDTLINAGIESTFFSANDISISIENRKTCGAKNTLRYSGSLRGFGKSKIARSKSTQPMA